MVTLRRDIAANADNRIFDKGYTSTAEPTEYDLFMAEKTRAINASRSAFNDYSVADVKHESYFSSASACDDLDVTKDYDYTYFGQPSTTVEAPKEGSIPESYNAYMLEQLMRSEKKENVLSEAEYYETIFNKEKREPAEVVVKSESKRKDRKKMTKTGKIFIAFYVLIVAVVASIILAVNTVDKPEKVDAEAGTSDAAGIASMDINDESGENNWFDSFLDGMSND